MSQCTVGALNSSDYNYSKWYPLLLFPSSPVIMGSFEPLIFQCTCQPLKAPTYTVWTENVRLEYCLWIPPSTSSNWPWLKGNTTRYSACASCNYVQCVMNITVLRGSIVFITVVYVLVSVCCIV